MKVSFLVILPLVSHKVFNKITLTIEESIHVSFDETNHSKDEKAIHFDEDDAKQNKQKEEHQKDYLAQQEQTNDDLPQE